MSTIRIGEYNVLEVQKQVDFGFYLGSEEDVILLPGKWAPPGLAVGDPLRVFVYTDSEDRPIATTQEPLATIGEFALMRIVDITRHGAFADWGLEKDLFVPYGLQKTRLEKGQSYVVYVSLHPRTNRVVGATELRPHFDGNLDALEVGQEVDLIVFNLNDVGAQVLVAERHSGIVYHNDCFERLRRGERLKGWIEKIREDGRLDIALRRRGRDANDEAQQIVVDALVEASGSLALHDKSPPEEIQLALGLSKKVFKKAIGGLYRRRLLQMTEVGIALTKAGWAQTGEGSTRESEAQ